MRLLPTIAVPALLALSACAEPDLARMFNQVELSVADDEATAAARFIDTIDAAQQELHVALPAGQTVEITDAIGRAWSDRGVAVEVITDIDQQNDPGIEALIDAGVPVTLACDDIQYFDFNVNDDVTWTSDQTFMTHAYAIADRRRMVTADSIGWQNEGARVVLELSGEDLLNDVLMEHNQVFGGTDATTTTAYNALAKSITDTRWRYSTPSDIGLQMWIGPQERVVKRVVDSIYGARSTVWVLTNQLANEGLARALQDKAEWGFDVQVIVGPAFDESSILSREFANSTPDVDKRRATGIDRVPTVVLVDFEPDSTGHRRPRGMFLTHDLVSAARLFRGSEVINDQLIDGLLWVIDEDDEELSPENLALQDLWQRTLDQSEGF